MTLLNLPDLRHGYVDVINYVLDNGEPSAPRGLQTLEVLGVTLKIEDPVDTLPLGVGRLASPKLAAIEALQLVGGYSDVEQAKRVSPHLAHFEDLGRFHGAYGPRVLPQLAPAVRRLVEDPESRRAVINVWDPVQDLLVHGVKNYPCTTQLQFLIRDDRLSLYTTMRANDAWKGLAYDAFTFAQLQLTVARALGIEPGPYYHHAVSLHLYEPEWDKASQLTKGEGAPKPATGFGYTWPRFDAHHGTPHERKLAWLSVEERLFWAVRHAREIGAGDGVVGPTDSEKWYIETLDGLL